MILYSVYILLILVTMSECLPTNPEEQVGGGSEEKALSNGFQWASYKVATIATAIIVVGASLATLTALFFPIFAYKICYALGGCQNMLDSYVDRFIGVEGETRRIKRDLKESDDLKLLMNILQMATRQYNGGERSDDISQAETTSTTTTARPTNHLIEKRSPIDYIEPILSLVSKAYNEYMDPGLKKNSEKPPYIR